MLDTLPSIREFPDPDETITTKLLEKIPGITPIREEMRKKAARFLKVGEEEKFTLTPKGHKFFLLKLSTDPELNGLYQQAVRTGKVRLHFDIADLHSHTNHIDGILSPGELVDNAVSNGITILAVTEHNQTKAAQDAKKYAHKKYPDQIEIILGVELATTEGHLLVYCSDEHVLTLLEKEFPVIEYMNNHSDEITNDYNNFYARLIKEGPHACSIEETLAKIQKIRNRLKHDPTTWIKTAAAHPFAGSSRIAKWCNDRGLTSAGGLMTHPDFREDVLQKIDLFEAHNDSSTAGYPFNCNHPARQYARKKKMVNLTTGSDTHIADPQALTLVQKGTNFFEELQSGRTIFIRREPNESDLLSFDNVKIFPWFFDNYMSEAPIEKKLNGARKNTKSTISDTLFSLILSQAKIKFFRDMQVLIRKKMFQTEHIKWKKNHHH